MIVVQLTGGLGNQLFQYACARALALKHNTSLVLNTSWFRKYEEGVSPRNFLLENFSLK